MTSAPEAPATIPSKRTTPAGILQEDVAEYLDAIGGADDPILAEVREAGSRDDVPIVSDATGRFLELLVRMHDPSHVVEFGTAIGYSTLWLLRGMAPGTVLTSFEIDEGRWQQATAYLDRAAWGNEVETKLVLGDARESFSAQVESLDFAFVDASKDEYGSYLDLVLDNMVPGGVIVVDNALMGGSVARTDPDPRWEPAEVTSQQSINQRLMADPRLRASVLPIGDGVLVAWMRNDLATA